MQRVVRRLRGYLCMLLIGCVIFVSCEDEGPDYSTWVDAVLTAQIIEDSVVYAPMFMAYSYQMIKGAKAIPESDSTLMYRLVVDDVNSGVAAWSPAKTDFSNQMPVMGDYNFTVEFEEGIIREAEDRIFDDILEPPVITEILFDSENHQLNIDWLDVDDADLYRVLLASQEGKTLYRSEYQSTALSSYLIEENDNSWSELPENGDSIIVRVEAYMFEPYAQIGDHYNYQCISFNQSETFVWE